MEEFIKEKKEIPYIKVGNKFKAEFVSMTHDGYAVARIKGLMPKGELKEAFPVFVDLALPKEAGIIELTELKASYAKGKILKLFNDKKVDYRVEPACPNFYDCGGCQLMHMNYDAQLSFKKTMLKETLRKIGGFDDIVLNKIRGAENPNYYRNKVQVPFQLQKGKTVCGFFKRNTHIVSPITTCLIQSDEMTEIVKFIRNLCNEFRIKGYDELNNSGDIRHVLVKESTITGEIMVVFVMTRENVAHMDELYAKLVKRHPKIVSIIENINSQVTNTILGEKQKCVFGKNYIVDKLNGFSFKIGAKSFYQVNHDQTEVLYNLVKKVGKFDKEDILVDAYCGIGTIGITLANDVKEIYAVEIVEEAIKNAKENAKLNNISNIHFECNKAEVQLKKWLDKGVKPTAIVVDPPRKGCDLSLLKTIIELQIQKLVYVSCDPATLARDLKTLVNGGYEISSITPVDMFPQTTHVETITLLCLKEPKK